MTDLPGDTTPLEQSGESEDVEEMATTAKSLTIGDVKNYWIQAGGNPQAAAMAAAVANASSGLDPNITRTNPDGTTSVGLWLIPKNGQPPGSTDPLSNARAAVQMSSNGQDWQQWCVTWSDNNCGESNGTYLGNGANALGALAEGGEPYNVIGSQPSGSGTSAAAVSSSSTGSTTGSTWMRWAAIAVVVLIVFLLMRSRTKKEDTPETATVTE